MVLAARYLSAGEFNPRDEKGLLVAARHHFGDRTNGYGELAAFEGFQGADVNVWYASAGMQLDQRGTEWSFGLTHRDINGQKRSALFGAADFRLGDGLLLETAIGLENRNGRTSSKLDIAFVYRFDS